MYLHTSYFTILHLKPKNSTSIGRLMRRHSHGWPQFCCSTVPRTGPCLDNGGHGGFSKGHKEKNHVCWVCWLTIPIAFQLALGILYSRTIQNLTRLNRLNPPTLHPKRPEASAEGKRCTTPRCSDVGKMPFVRSTPPSPMLHHWQVYPRTSLSATMKQWPKPKNWRRLFKHFLLSASNQLFLFKHVTRPMEKQLHLRTLYRTTNELGTTLATKHT